MSLHVHYSRSQTNLQSLYETVFCLSVIINLTTVWSCEVVTGKFVIFFKFKIVQQDATVFSLLHFCRQLYMFRALHPSSGARTTVITASGID